MSRLIDADDLKWELHKIWAWGAFSDEDMLTIDRIIDKMPTVMPKNNEAAVKRGRSKETE